MELMKKNIHMDCCGNHTSTQITVEEDFVIPDVQPDISEVIFEHCQVKLEDARSSEDHVAIHGELEVAVLYQTEGSEKSLAHVQKTIPIREEVYLDGVKAGDVIDVKWKLEDLTVGVINSRKLNIRALLELKLQERSIRDEEAVSSFYDEEMVEHRQKTIQVVQLAVSKKDIYRVRQDIEIGNNLPNIQEILFSSVQGGCLDFRLQRDKILIKGEFPVFVLYEGEGEDAPVRFVERTLPVDGEIPCSGVREEMISDISWQITHVEVDKKPDFDGEERMLAIEVVCSLDIKLYEEEELSLLSDVYGVTREIEAETVAGSFRRLLIKNDGILRMEEKLRVKTVSPILQLIHQEGKAVIEEVQIRKGSLDITGTLLLQCLYVTGDDSMPYRSFKEALPFTYTMEIKDVRQDSIVHVDVCTGQLNVALSGSDEIEVKAQIHISVLAFEEIHEDIICDIKVGELDMERQRKLPGIVIYVVKEGDSLWDIGKKYYVPVEKIKELNGLVQDTCKPMDKLLIVRA